MTEPRLLATIHIGASAVSMIVLNQDGEAIDLLEKPLPLAHDIFGQGTVQGETIERCVAIIEGFRQALAEHGAPNTLIRAVATNTLTEAKNANIFANRLLIACDLDLETLDDGEMTRLVFLKTRRRLLDTPSMSKRNTIVVHAGPGNTRVLLFKNGQVIRYNSYRMGTHRTWEAIGQSDMIGEPILSLINEQVTSHISQIYYDFRNDNIEDIVIIGHEVQLLSSFLSKPDRTKSRLRTLQQLTREVCNATEDERVRRYHLDYQTAGSVVPALAINLSLAEIFGVTSVRVPSSDYQLGLLTDLTWQSEDSADFRAEVLRSAKHLAKRYRTDPRHAKHVAFLSLRLFEVTKELHQLEDDDAFLLEIAAILHETGNYISSRKHEEHSLYIVRQSEIFGLSQRDKSIVALITRYHRGPTPHPKHAIYGELTKEDRLRVAKISSLIRVADALERTHSQRVKDLALEVKSTRAYLKISGPLEATAERLALPSKADLFEQLFGLRLIIQES